MTAPPITLPPLAGARCLRCRVELTTDNARTMLRRGAIRRSYVGKCRECERAGVAAKPVEAYTVPIVVRLDADLHHHVTATALRTGWSIAEVIRHALRAQQAAQGPQEAPGAPRGGHPAP